MDKIVALCKRRGFIFQSSEIYGGLNGFWDYGPLGVELKRNVKDAWWRDMITNHDEFSTPPGAPQSFSMVGLDCSIIMHPQVWKCSGHYDLFADMMQTCQQCKKLFRADHVWDMLKDAPWVLSFAEVCQASGVSDAHIVFSSPDALNWARDRKRGVKLAPGLALVRKPEVTMTWLAEDLQNNPQMEMSIPKLLQYMATEQKNVTGLRTPCPHCGGDLTDPRRFNLMFETYTGAIQTEENRAFLRPETAQGMFVNFKNVVDTVRVKVPFGIAQGGKSFRNEITPRNFTFRSREFEQMEMEFFCHPSQSFAWYQYWRDRRYEWYLKLGLTRDKLRLRDHAKDELSHYSVGTADVEYAFPFLDAGEFGELEGIAHRGDFDLRSHMEGKLVKDADGNLIVELGPDGKPKYPGSGENLSYFDDQTRERFVPHVIEPAAGADRATLAFICEAYTEDKQPDEKGELQERILMKFHPKLAPLKAAVLPLVKKDGMPELGLNIYRELKSAGIPAYFDQQAAIGKRYRRQDEIGTPWCITIDGQTLQDQTVTIRDRDTLQQWRMPVAKVVDEIAGRLRG
ncbi:MAG TPA: glycine--tRNA ligase [Planctomycetaceae bacterium]|jgi:glycyl-tRNA synthetase